jgi:AcrR family transcriptional regulator
MVETRTPRGDDTRRAILQEAVRIGGTEGLDRLTIGRLATALGSSKSGVFGLFGSKEELQLAAIAEAKRSFVSDVISPALTTAPGLGRLWTLCSVWLDHSSADAKSGNCFFLSAGTEFDTRPGRIHEAIVTVWEEWNEFHRRTIVEAQQLGEITADTDPAQLAFELGALERGATLDLMLLGDPAVMDRARAAMHRLLRAHATNPAQLPSPDPGRA